ncbi:MAG: lamin tail domain-containing protein [archaeon]|nr:lamin tail domain-containing protein [archaeon]
MAGGATVTLYTGAGKDTTTELYWNSSGCRCNAVWNNDGDTLYLRDMNGNLVMSYSYSGFE